jgi:hypothetical protein
MIENIITDILVILVTSGIAYYLSGIKKTVKLNGEKTDKLNTQVNSLEQTVRDHTIMLTEITLINTVMGRIDLKIRQSLEYLDKDDVIIQAFIQKQGEQAKSCIEWAIHTNLKITEAEIRAKYETCNMEVRDLLVQTPPEFSQRIRPALIAIFQHHVNRVIEICKDELFNSKLDRFFTLTEQTVNEVLTTVIKGRIETKIHSKSNDPRMI